MLLCKLFPVVAEIVQGTIAHACSDPHLRFIALSLVQAHSHMGERAWGRDYELYTFTKKAINNYYEVYICVIYI